MIIHNVEQGTEEWLKLRELKLTASHGQEIANNGKGLDTYVKKLVLSKINPNADRFYGFDMQRGDELEPIARLKYEFERGVDVKEIGFVQYCNYSGYSPDGFVSDDGLIEIKARNDEKHLDLILTDKIDTKTIWQMQTGLLMTKRKWCDFISYNPNFGEKSLYVKRVFKDEEKFKALDIGLASGKVKLVKLLNNDKIQMLING